MTSKMWSVVVAGVLCVALAGCAMKPSAGELARISPGMSKSQVLSTLGTPSSASSKNKVEMLYYDLVTRDGTGEFYVRVVDGCVESYGPLDNADAETRPGIAEKK